MPDKKVDHEEKVQETPVNVVNEAKKILEILGRIFKTIDGYFPSKCVVRDVLNFKNILSPKIGGLVMADISDADKYLWDLKIDPAQDPEKVRIRIRALVSSKLRDDMRITTDAEVKAEDAMKAAPADKKCKATEDWAKAHLKATAAAELFGQWSLIDVVDPQESA